MNWPVEPATAAQFSFIFTAIVTVAGWFVVSRQADRREFRKELREHLAELRDRAAEVRTAADGYWVNSTAKTEKAAAARLKSDVDRLSRQWRFLGKLGLDCSDAPMIEVRKEATGGDFEVAKRKKSVDDVFRLAQLAGALEDLQTEADEAFFRKFQPISVRAWGRRLPFLAVLLLRSDGP